MKYTLDKKKKVLGIGNPLLDIAAEVESELLDKYSLKLNNAILADESHKKLFKELKERKNVKFIAGGSTLNSMRTCQWYSKMDSFTFYIGCIGNDKYGKILEECALRDKVRCYFMRIDNQPTGICAVAIHQKERSLCTSLGAANSYDISHLKQKEIQEIIQDVDIYYIAGYFLTVSLNTLIEVGEHAVNNNKPMLFNLSAGFIPEFYMDSLLTAIEYTDYLFMNQEEARDYNKFRKLNLKNLEEISKNLANLPKKNNDRKRAVIITRGSSSTLLYYNDKISYIDVDPLKFEEIVDLNGAGDAFIGGFLSELVKDSDIIECIRVGHITARLIIQQSSVSLN